jgi:FMN-dependent NADH-azoreductase
MKKNLPIKSSPHIEATLSRKIGQKVLEKIQEKYPDNETTTGD